jgi:hypothetical protein
VWHSVVVWMAKAMGQCLTVSCLVLFLSALSEGREHMLPQAEMK